MGDWLGDSALGLAYGQVRLVPSNPGWPGAFRRLAVELQATLGDLAVAVEHVGSTAVPGLAAKVAFIGHLLSEDGRTAPPTEPTSKRRGRR
jgi:hypothetical protein